MPVNFNIPLLINASGDVVVYAEDVSGDFFDVDYVLDVSNGSLSAAHLNNTFYFTDASDNSPPFSEKLFAIDVSANGSGLDLSGSLCKNSPIINSLYNDCMTGGTEHGAGTGKLHLMHSLVSHWAPNSSGQAFGHGGNEKIATAADTVNLGQLMVRYLSAVLLGDFKNQAVIKDDETLANKINDVDNMKDQLVNIFMRPAPTSTDFMAKYVDGSNNNHVASENPALLSIWEFMKANGRYEESHTVNTFNKFAFRTDDTFSIYIEVSLDLLRNDPLLHTDDEGNAADGDPNSNLNFKTLFDVASEFMDGELKMKKKIWKIRWTLN